MTDPKHTNTDPLDEADEALESLASGLRGWAHGELDGTSFIGEELAEIEKTKAEAAQAINNYINSRVEGALKIAYGLHDQPLTYGDFLEAVNAELNQVKGEQ